MNLPIRILYLIIITYIIVAAYALLGTTRLLHAQSASVVGSEPGTSLNIQKSVVNQAYSLTTLPMIISQSSNGPVRINQSIDGSPLTINDQVYSQGIGTHAASLIAYDLEGLCSSFSATVGVDDEVSNRGSVTFQVIANQSTVYDSGPMTGADDARASGALDVTGVRELLLVVRSHGQNSADDSIWNDHADWVNPTLTCAEQPNGDGTGLAHIRGSWGPIMDWPVKAIHASLLPSGHLLTHASAETGSIGGIDPDAPHNMTKVDLSDIATWGHQWVDHTSEEMYCSSHTLLADGSVFEIGGHGGADSPPNSPEHYYGQDQASTFDFPTLQWNAEANMSQARWYPTAVTLGNGDVMAIGGTHAGGNSFLPEIWDGNGWRTLSNASYAERINTGDATNDHTYPFVHLLSDGRLFWSGWDENMAYLTPTGNGSWGPNYFREARQRAWAAPVMYRQDKILLAGGIDHQGNYGYGTSTAVTIDLTADAPGVAQTSTMLFSRADADGTILPNGEVFVNGGGYEHTLDPSPHHYFVPEIWNPDSGEWHTGAAATNPRGYHSTTLLLPDGRVWTGGGECGTGCPKGKTAQIYSPPYLFRSSPAGNGNQPAQRPIIDSAPDVVAYGQSFGITLSEGGDESVNNISKVTLIRLGSTTHTYNFEQRYLELEYSQNGSNLSLMTPATGNMAPPGYYMLFVLNDDGVPSVAEMLRLTEQPPNILGDVNCDNDVSAVDALFILQNNVGLRADSGACPLIDENSLYVDASDVDGNGVTTAADALFILQCEVGISNAFCPEARAATIMDMEEMNTEEATAAAEAKRLLAQQGLWKVEKEASIFVPLITR